MNSKKNIRQWSVIALTSLIFCVLIGLYRSQIYTQSNALDAWISPIESITHSLMNASGSSDDSLVRSRIAAAAEQISGLDLHPEITTELSKYISNMYAVAGARDAAKKVLPQTHDWEYLFTRGTIDLLQTNSLLSGDVLALYSGRQTIQEAIEYLSGATMSTTNKENKHMSIHNLSVALASQIGVEISLCTKSYTALSQGRTSILNTLSGLQNTYATQIQALQKRKSDDICVQHYQQELEKNMPIIKEKQTLVHTLASLAEKKDNAYRIEPLTCPAGIDLSSDIRTIRSYASDLTAQLISATLIENILATGSINDLRQICEQSTQQGTTGTTTLSSLLSELTGQQQNHTQQAFSGQHTNTGSYQALPEDTNELIRTIYENNTHYIKAMEQSKEDINYRPLQRLYELFKEFHGDTTQFIK